MLKGRFAPSPTGRMHLGNVWAALLSWLSVRSQGGQWLLRIEDIDPQRSRQAWADLLMQDLEWLGLTWDEGPYYQSQRSAVYEAYLEILNLQGLIYPCYCTRADIQATQAPHESDGRVVYKGTCRPATTDTRPLAILPTNTALRMMVPTGAQAMITFEDRHYGPQTVDLEHACGDFIVCRKDGAWAYQLAVVVDDALMGVNEVVRGRDLLLSSPQQIYLAHTLGFSAPRFSHVPLLVNESGQRLSKRDESTHMEVLRQRYTPAEILGRLAFWAGLTDQEQALSAEELVPLFDWNKIPRQDILALG